MHPKQLPWTDLSRFSDALQELSPEKRNAADALYHRFRLGESEATRDVRGIYDFLHSPIGSEILGWSPIRREELRPPTADEMSGTVKLINRFIRLASVRWAAGATDAEIRDFDVNSTQMERAIFGELWVNARSLRQAKGVTDTPALVAAEHYLVGRGYVRGRINSQAFNSLAMLAMIPGYDVFKGFIPNASEKPAAPRWLWARAWSYYGAFQ